MKDEKIYLSRMADAMEDKLFFVEHLPKEVATFVDYGCADGALIEELVKIYPNANFIGYDNNTDFIAHAEKYNTDKVFFTSDWEQVEHIMSFSVGVRVLILSSVLHEIYTYEDAANILNFWQRVKSFRYDYICVRDMGIRWADCNRMVAREMVNQVYQWANVSRKRRWQLNDFEAKCGTITNSSNLCEFLLKYSYIENWGREVKEHYFAFATEDVFSHMDELGLSPIYFQHWVLPYVADKVKNDFGITMPYNTHYKGVWKR